MRRIREPNGKNKRNVMKFYRTLQPFQVISFDLDDTLYDNSQVMIKAESEFLAFLRQYDGVQDVTHAEWVFWKETVGRENPLLQENVTAWRTQSLQALLAKRQKSAVDISAISEKAMSYFLHWRHQIDVPTKSFEILQQLKQHYKLVAMTNGNVEPARIGFHHFDLTLRGGEHGRAKPHEDLFRQTARHFNISPHQLLHVGDNLQTDVQGAIQAGCQAVWLNLTQKHIYQFSDARLLPTVEMSDLSALLSLHC